MNKLSLALVLLGLIGLAAGTFHEKFAKKQGGHFSSPSMGLSSLPAAYAAYGYQPYYLAQDPYVPAYGYGTGYGSSYGSGYGVGYGAAYGGGYGSGYGANYGSGYGSSYGMGESYGGRANYYK